MKDRSYNYYLLLAAMAMFATFTETKPMENLKDFIREMTNGELFHEQDLQEYKDQAKTLLLTQEKEEKTELDKHGPELIALLKKGRPLKEVQDEATVFFRHSARLQVLQRDMNGYVEDIDMAFTKKQATKVKNKFYHNLKAWTSTLTRDETFIASTNVKLVEVAKKGGTFYSMPEQTIGQKLFQPKSKGGAFKTSMMPGCKGFSLKAMVVQRARGIVLKNIERLKTCEITSEQRALGGLHEYSLIPTPNNTVIAPH